MPARVAIRRLVMRGLVPRDHPAPDDLRSRLLDAARGLLAESLANAMQAWPGGAVLRIRRLEVDVTVGAAFEPAAFASLLARAVAAGLRRAERSAGETEAGDGLIRFPSQPHYLGALLEALAERRATGRWWLPEAEGLRFLSAAAAIRTALLTDPAVGREALAAMPPRRLATILTAMTAHEAERVLDGLAEGLPTTGADACAAAIAHTARDLPAPACPLLLFIRAAAEKPALTGPSLAAAARHWHTAARVRASASAVPMRERASRRDRTTTALLPQPHPPDPFAPQQEAHVADLVFTQFGGLLLLLPSLDMDTIASRTSGPALVGYAVLGVCAGRERFGRYLADPLWRELFGLDPQVTAAEIVASLAEVEAETWEAISELNAPPKRQRDARFLLPPRALVGSRAATHALAGTGGGLLRAFARRLAGFGDASAPFLWANLLSVNAVFERGERGWSARLSRPALDVLLSLSRIAEGEVIAPSGARITIARATS